MAKTPTNKTRIENRWPVAREGLPFIISTGLIGFLLIFTGFPFYAIPIGIIFLFVTYFFRDPERRVYEQANGVLTPADGTILNIRHIDNSSNPLGEPAYRISVFMSLFNVHVNRIPVGGRILDIAYNPGKFFAANLEKSSGQNENNQITLLTDNGLKIVFIQIAGFVARRIACWVKEKDHVKAGQRCGLIRFGSRLDIYLPFGSRVIIQPGDKVRAGETIIAFLPLP
jgi:phosphatidylserine decarboxylase